jgi:hypothetical protein
MVVDQDAFLSKIRKIARPNIMRSALPTLFVLALISQPATALHADIFTTRGSPPDIYEPESSIFGSPVMAWCDPSLCGQLGFLSTGSEVWAALFITGDACGPEVCGGPFTGSDIAMSPIFTPNVSVGDDSGYFDDFAFVFEDNTFGSLDAYDVGAEITLLNPGTMIEIYIDYPHILDYVGGASATTAPVQVQSEYLVLRFDGTRERIDVLSLDIFNGGSDSQFIPLASNTIPVPPAVWLFGSALAILGWVRRRKLH